LRCGRRAVPADGDCHSDTHSNGDRYTTRHSNSNWESTAHTLAKIAVILACVVFSEVVIIASGGSSGRAGPATAGKVFPPDGHDLSAKPLMRTFALSL
jgi:hypothetical protein